MANTQLREARLAEGLSQQGLAEEIQRLGDQLGHPNDCNKSAVHRWEDGAQPRPWYVLLLRVALNRSPEELGIAYQQHGMNLDELLETAGLDVLMPEPDEGAGVTYGPLSGIWMSEYQIYSSSRGKHFSYRHYVLVLQRGPGVKVRSLPKQASSVSLDLNVNGRMGTGTWAERTRTEGYYGGAPYSGAIQMELGPADDRMTGMWVGYGRTAGEMNTGPWKLTRVDEHWGREAREKWDTEPPPVEGQEE